MEENQVFTACGIELNAGSRPWRARKMANELLALAYESVDLNKAERLRNCATQVVFSVSPDGRRRLSSANFCRVRLCPVWQWRRSLKTFSQLKEVFDYFHDNGFGFSYVFLTLTVPNAVGVDLKDTLDRMQLAWTRFSRRKEFKQAFKGYFKSVEVTHNLDDDTYHPHYHIVLAVKPSYFKSRYYLSHDRLVDLWCDAMRCDTPLMVDVRKVRSSKSKATTTDEVAVALEVSKYTVKVGGYIVPDDWDMTENTVRILDKALDKRRFLSFGGCFTDARRVLQQDDPDDGDLIHIQPDNVLDDGERQVVYAWSYGYKEYRPVEYTSDSIN